MVICSNTDRSEPIVSISLRSCFQASAMRFKDESWSGITGMRDSAAHHYHNNNLVKQWNTIRRDIPALRDVCLRIKSDLESGSEDA